MAKQKQSASKKRPSKSSQRVAVQHQPGANGGTLQIGNPGNKGGTGRPPDAFKARMRELSDIWQQKEHVESVIRDTEHPHFMSAGKYVTDQGYGAVPKPVEVSGKDGEALVIKIVREG